MDQKPQLIVLNSASDCIDIHLLDGKGYIFHTQDAFALQYGRRIHADWIGSMPLHPNQSVWLTLPCVLSPEHIYVGLIEGFMRCWRHDLGRKPTLEQVQRHEYHRKMVAQQQSMEIEQISAQMRKKHLVGSNSSENEKSTPGVEDNPPTLTYLPSLLTWDSLASDQPDNPQSPSTLPLEEFLSSLSTRERNRSLVYHDLWKKGYHITNGVKFGGDFLVYKGDPSIVHADFIIIVKDISSDVSGLEIIQSGRLAVSVNKTHIYAILEDSVIRYLTCSWMG